MIFCNQKISAFAVPMLLAYLVSDAACELLRGGASVANDKRVLEKKTMAPIGINEPDIPNDVEASDQLLGGWDPTVVSPGGGATVDTGTFDIPITNIIGGSDTTFPNHPYFVELLGFSDNRRCGASLIWHDVALTAAHCGGFLNARLGPNNERVPILSGTQHPNWVPPRQNDLMVVKLARSVTDAATGGVIIGLQNDSDPALVATDELVVIGLGYVNSTAREVPNELQEVTVNYIPNSVCNSSSYYNGQIYDNMLCAGVAAGGKDSCHGDSGGPLFLSGGKQVGVVSWGIGCAEANHPGVYASVSAAYDWIQEMICCHSATPPANCGNLTHTCPNHIDITLSHAPTPSPITCPSGEKLFVVDLSTDGFGQETSWNLTDDCTSTVVGSGSGFGSGTQYIEQVCLDEAHNYSFTIYDTWGDGNCCGYGKGGYSISYDGDLLKTGGKFKKFETTTFGSSCLCESGETLFVLNLKTDGYAQESSWDLIDDCNSTVVRSVSTLVSNTHYTEEVCVDATRQYTFRINDSYGDGICCEYGNGAYSVYNGYNGETLLRSGAVFGRFENTTFGSCPVPSPRTNPPASPAGPRTTPPTAEPTHSPTVQPTATPSAALTEILDSDFQKYGTPNKSCTTNAGEVQPVLCYRNKGDYVVDWVEFLLWDQHGNKIQDTNEDGIPVVPFVDYDVSHGTTVCWHYNSCYGATDSFEVKMKIQIDLGEAKNSGRKAIDGTVFSAHGASGYCMKSVGTTENNNRLKRMTRQYDSDGNGIVEFECL